MQRGLCERERARLRHPKSLDDARIVVAGAYGTMMDDGGEQGCIKRGIKRCLLASVMLSGSQGHRLPVDSIDVLLHGVP